MDKKAWIGSCGPKKSLVLGCTYIALPSSVHVSQANNIRATIMTFKTTAFLLSAGMTWASPSPVQRADAACTPTAGGSPSTDDVPAIVEAISSCGNGGTIVIPEGSTYHLNTVLDLDGCSGCEFQIEGTLQFSDDTGFWNGETAMINVKDVEGLTMHSLTGSGVIDGNGQTS